MKKIISKIMFFTFLAAFSLSSSLTAFADTSLPDLTITNLTIVSRKPTVINYTCTITNTGNATLSNIYYVSIQNFFSDNTIFCDAGDVAAGGTLLAVNRSLAPGESYTFNFGAYGSAGTKSYLTAKLDWSNSIAELNEDNNTIAVHL